MFRFSFLVDDKHVTTVLRGLDGIARDLQCVPFIVAPPRAPRMERVKVDGPTYNVLLNYMREKNMEEITGPEAKNALKELGVSFSSYSHYLRSAVRDGKLKQIKSVKGGRTPPHSRFSLVTLREVK